MQTHTLFLSGCLGGCDFIILITNMPQLKVSLSLDSSRERDTFNCGVFVECGNMQKKKKVDSVRERLPLVGRVSSNFCGYRMPCGQRGGSLRPYSRFSRPKPLLFLQSTSSIVLTMASRPRSRPNTSNKIW
jgi:hypothetical protein